MISSDSDMDLNCIKYVELEIFKKKPVLIKERLNSTSNQDFRETSELATEEAFKPSPEDGKNI
jgi:hypothetical protein